MIYLDNAATSYQKPYSFYKAMDICTKKYSVNSGRGSHSFSTSGAMQILKTSELLCDLFSIDNPERIAYTYNATMSLNLAIGGILKKGGHAVVTAMEHNSVLRPVHSFGNYTVVPADSFGRVSASDIANAIKTDTKLVICTHASNVCGTVEPIAEIAKTAHKSGAIFLLDAAQTAGCKKINVEKLGIDMLAFSAHKGLLGPLGVGGLYVKEGIELEPVLFGGTGSESSNLNQPTTMPDFLQSGTVNTAGIVALAESLRFIKSLGTDKISAYQKSLAYEFISLLKNMKNVSVYGITNTSEGERNGTVLFNIADLDSTYVCEILNNRFNIAMRGGWHCAYSAHRALGTEKSGGIRASFGIFSNRTHVKKAADAVYKIVMERI